MALPDQGPESTSAQYARAIRKSGEGTKDARATPARLLSSPRSQVGAPSPSAALGCSVTLFGFISHISLALGLIACHLLRPTRRPRRRCHWAFQALHSPAIAHRAIGVYRPYCSNSATGQLRFRMRDFSILPCQASIFPHSSRYGTRREITVRGKVWWSLLESELMGVRQGASSNSVIRDPRFTRSLPSFSFSAGFRHLGIPPNHICTTSIILQRCYPPLHIHITTTTARTVSIIIARTVIPC